MNRQLSLTPTEAGKFAALAVGESMWNVREGADCTLGDHCYAAHDDNAQHPPVEFVQACAPCEVCKGTRQVKGMWHESPAEPLFPCPDCRIELLGPNPTATSWTAVCPTWGHLGTVTLGYAYATGEPLLLTAENIGHHYYRLAHYGPPESLPGQWAIEVRKA